VRPGRGEGPPAGVEGEDDRAADAAAGPAGPADDRDEEAPGGAGDAAARRQLAAARLPRVAHPGADPADATEAGPAAVPRPGGGGEGRAPAGRPEPAVG